MCFTPDFFLVLFHTRVSKVLVLPVLAERSSEQKKMGSLDLEEGCVKKGDYKRVWKGHVIKLQKGLEESL